MHNGGSVYILTNYSNNLIYVGELPSYLLEFKRTKKENILIVLLRNIIVKGWFILKHS